MRKTYNLSLHPSLEQYRSELEFACAFVDQCHPVTRTDTASAILVHYGPEPPIDAVHIPSALFPDGVMIDAEGIHPNLGHLKLLETGADAATLLPPKIDGARPNGKNLGYDALGLIFMMLSRLEERGNEASQEDRYGRFPFEGSLQARLDGLDIPYADIAAKDIASTILGTSNPEMLTKYNVLLTHDVDRLRGFDTVKYLTKIVIGDIIFRRNIRLAAERVWEAAASGEPWKSCRYVMANAEKHGHTCRFFFMGPTENKLDDSYSIRWPEKLRRLADEIVGRGHLVGFHPGTDTPTDQAEWERQRHGLEQIIGRKVYEGRQHRLLFQADTTWDIWDRGEMKAEMTLGYPAPSGFRSGTCRSHPIYSLRQRRTLALRSYPTAIMDFGLFDGKYRNLSLASALEECQRIIDICKFWGGDLVILYHPAKLTKLRRNFFEQLLERL
jgi:hypothetical protein